MSETENQSTEAVETSTSDSAPMTSTPPQMVQRRSD